MFQLCLTSGIGFVEILLKWTHSDFIVWFHSKCFSIIALKELLDLFSTNLHPDHYIHVSVQ